jgi:MFS family permease
LLLGQSTSFIGSMLTQVAVPVQIWALTHSTLYVGYVGLAGLLPIVAFGLYGGAIADAVDRRTLYLWSSIGGWVVTLALLAQTLLDVRDVWLILGLVAVQSAMFAIASSTRGAIIPRIVPAELVPAANTLNFTVGNVGQVAGPSSRASSSRCHTGSPTPTASTPSSSPQPCTPPSGCRPSRPTARRGEPACASWPTG